MQILTQKELLPVAKGGRVGLSGGGRQNDFRKQKTDDGDSEAAAAALSAAVDTRDI